MRVLLAVLFSLSGLIPETFAYELLFNDEESLPCTVCWAAPVNHDLITVNLDGHLIQMSKERDSAGELRFCGAGVSGRLSNDVLTVVSTWDGLRGTYCFRGGRLASFTGEGSDDGRKTMRRRLLRNCPPIERRLCFWPGEGEEDWKMFWQGSGRLKLWFENPNEAGALLVLLALLALGASLSSSGLCRVPLFLLTAVLFLLELCTGSRGGVVTFVFGTLAMFLVRIRFRITLRRLVIGGILCAFIAAIVFLLFGHLHVIKHLVALDAGNRIRLGAWSAFPRMMICAPFGWWSPPGCCYCDWFQALGDNYQLYYLVNSHLTIMAYGGVLVAFLYVFLWIWVLHRLLRDARRSGRSLALGVWVGFAVAMWFSTIGVYHWELWVIPVVVLASYGVRSFRERGIDLSGTKVDAALAVSLVAVITAIGFVLERGSEDPFAARRVCGGVKVGHGAVTTCIINDDIVLTGGMLGVLGKELRSCVLKHPGMGVQLVDSLERIQNHPKKLVLTGRFCAEYVEHFRSRPDCPVAEETYFLSPTYPLPEIPQELMDRSRVRMILGELVADAYGVDLFRPSWMTVVPAMGLYITDWKERVGLFASGDER